MALISVDIGMFLRADLKAAEQGAMLFRALEKHCPALMPQRMGNFEPVRNVFPEVGWQGFLSTVWNNPILWTRKKPKAEGMIMLPVLRDPVALSLRVSIEAALVPALVAWFCEIATTLSCEYGYIHSVAPAEREYLRQRDVLGYVDRAGKVVFVLLGYPQMERKGVPAVFWANIFGPRYLTPKVRAAVSSAHEVKQLSADMLYVQVTNSIADLHARHDEFSQHRDQIEEKLLPLLAHAN